MMDDEFSASSLLDFLSHEPAPVPASPVSQASSQQRFHTLVHGKSTVGQSPTSSTATPNNNGASTGNMSSPTPSEAVISAPATPAPAECRDFRRRASSKNMDTDKKSTETPPKPPLYKSLSTTSDLDGQPQKQELPPQDLANLFEEVSEAKAAVAKEPADKNKAKKPPQADLHC